MLKDSRMDEVLLYIYIYIIGTLQTPGGNPKCRATISARVAMVKLGDTITAETRDSDSS
jgi:hypothetical protein